MIAYFFLMERLSKKLLGANIMEDYFGYNKKDKDIKCKDIKDNDYKRKRQKFFMDEDIKYNYYKVKREKWFMIIIIFGIIINVIFFKIAEYLMKL